MTTTVINRHHLPRGSALKSNQVYIGRPSKWGNPYIIGRDGTRDDVIAKYRLYLSRHTELVTAARAELRGKELVCYCRPMPCHGELLARVAEGEEP